MLSMIECEEHNLDYLVGVHKIAESPKEFDSSCMAVLTGSDPVRKSFPFQFSFNVFGLHERGYLILVLFFFNIYLTLGSFLFNKIRSDSGSNLLLGNFI